MAIFKRLAIEANLNAGGEQTSSGIGPNSTLIKLHICSFFFRLVSGFIVLPHSENLDNPLHLHLPSQ